MSFHMSLEEVAKKANWMIQNKNPVYVNWIPIRKVKALKYKLVAKLRMHNSKHKWVEVSLLCLHDNDKKYITSIDTYLSTKNNSK